VGVSPHGVKKKAQLRRLQIIWSSDPRPVLLRAQHDETIRQAEEPFCPCEGTDHAYVFHQK